MLRVYNALRRMVYDLFEWMGELGISGLSVTSVHGCVSLELENQECMNEFHTCVPVRAASQTSNHSSRINLTHWSTPSNVYAQSIGPSLASR